MDALKKYKHFFGVLAVAKPELRRALLLKADDALLKAITEVVLNTVQRNVPLASTGVKKLRKYRPQLRNLADGYFKSNKKRRPSLKTQRKRLLQKGGGFIPTIFSNILAAFEKKEDTGGDGLCRNDPAQ